MTFIEANCLIFDKSRDDCKEYRELHGSYSALVTILLDAFREDTTLTHDQIIKAMVEMSKKAELHQIFKGLFEQILATESLRIFVRIMTQKNIELQQQALMMIMKQLGRTPHSTKSKPAAKPAKPKVPQAAPATAADKSAASSRNAESASPPTEPARSAKPEPLQSAAPVEPPAVPPTNEQEDRILESVIGSTEAHQDAEHIMRGLSADDVERTVALSEAEASLLESERRREDEKLLQAVQSLVVGGDPANHGESPSAPTGEKSKVSHLSDLPPLGGASIGVSFFFGHPLSAHAGETQQAAASGDSSGQAEAQPSLPSMSQDEVKQRQEFLRQQREKLLELKKKEREKQLEIYERSQPAPRPKSSRAARAVIAQAEPTQPSISEEEEKRVAMRRAIANRLKEEMMSR